MQRWKCEPDHTHEDSTVDLVFVITVVVVVVITVDVTGVTTVDVSVVFTVGVTVRHHYRGRY